MMDIVEPGAPSGATQAASVAQTAQEEEDAAMAKRLQEELYQGQAAATDEDGVRAPMARTTETLVAPSGPWSMDNDTDDMHIIFQNEMRRRNQLGQLSSLFPLLVFYFLFFIFSLALTEQGSQN